MMAEKRAAAAEIIAKEANAIRLKALLDAAREEFTARTIRSAEDRFAAARSDWEAVRQGLRPEPDPYAELDQPAAKASAPLSLAAIAARLPALTGVPRRKAVLFGGLPALLLIAGLGAAAYLHAAAETAPVGRVPVQALGAPPAVTSDGSARIGPGDAVASRPVDSAPAGETVSKTSATPADVEAPPLRHAAVTKTRKTRLILPPPPPPPPASRPDPETLAAGAPAPAQRPGPSPAVE